jgi:hypothetical protein
MPLFCARVRYTGGAVYAKTAGAKLTKGHAKFGWIQEGR